MYHNLDPKAGVKSNNYNKNHSQNENMSLYGANDNQTFTVSIRCSNSFTVKV